MPIARYLLLTGISVILVSCQTIDYCHQAVVGHLEILSKCRPNASVISDPASSPALRRQLELANRLRLFASDRLSLPGESSYGKYADIGRDHLVWVIYAAPEFSLKPKSWFYPVIGKMDYRGYFREDDSRAFASQLEAEGNDVFIGDVDAYSTLGWFHDPILNTFVNYPDIDLAETIFHELTHRKIFRSGDTDFNESLANTVAEEGVKRWLENEGRHKELKIYQQRLLHRREFFREIENARTRLEILYASDIAAPSMRLKKTEIMLTLREQFRELHQRWGGRWLDSWMKRNINNGHIISLKIYADQMPVFQELLQNCDGNLDLFFKKVKKLKRPN
jgi:predicted aminopeptidase